MRPHNHYFPYYPGLPSGSGAQTNLANIAPQNKEDFQIVQNELNVIMSFGFTHNTATDALRRFPGDINSALSYALDHQIASYPEKISPQAIPKPVSKIKLENVSDKTYKTLRKSEKSCDVIFIVGKGKKEILAHKFILANSSPEFEKIFYFDPKIKENKIVIEEADPEDFEVFLDYCYQFEISPISFDRVISLFKFAHKYLMTDLKKYLELLFQKSLTRKNCFRAYESTQNEILNPLNDIVKNYIKIRSTQILKHGNVFNELRKETFISILDSKSLLFGNDMLKRIIEYIKDKSQGKDKKEKREEWKSVINMMDLTKLDLEGLEIAKTSDLFPKRDVLTAILNILNSEEILPENKRA